MSEGVVLNPRKSYCAPLKVSTNGRAAGGGGTGGGAEEGPCRRGNNHVSSTRLGWIPRPLNVFYLRFEEYVFSVYFNLHINVVFEHCSICKKFRNPMGLLFSCKSN